MKRPVITSALLFALTTWAVSQEAVPEKADRDARLDKKVSAKVAMLPIQTALKVLSKGAGFPLEATNAMAPLKVTILVKDEPVGVVMDRLADLFHGEWKAVGTLYRLSVPNEWTSKEAAYIQSENRAWQSAAAASLRAISDAASVPYEQVLQELGNPRTSSSRRSTLQLVQRPGTYLLGYTLAHFNGSQWSAFWAGRPLRAVGTLPGEVRPSASPSSGVRSPNGVAPGPNPQGSGNRNRNPGNRGETPRSPARTIVASAYYDSLTGRLISSENFPGVQAEANGSIVVRPYPQEDLAPKSFGAELIAWPQIEEKVESLDAQVEDSPPPASYSQDKRSLSDVLTWLHEETGAPIVADAFRSPVQISDSAQGGTLRDWLKYLRSAGEFVRTRDGFVMVRHGGYWRLRWAELPESAFASMEKTEPRLDDYAAFAALLTPIQAMAFRIPNAVLTRFDAEPLRTALPALRFFGSLSSAERRTAREGIAIPYSRLGSISRDRFQEAIDDRFGRVLGAGAPDPSVAANALGFLMSNGLAERATDGRSRAVGDAIQMLFGVSPRQGAQFLIPINP